MLVGIIITAGGFYSDLLGGYLGPFDYRGFLVFAYPDGENPIDSIVFTLDSTIAGNVIVVDVPSPWSHSYSGGALTLTGGSLSPGGSVTVTVSLNRYFEAGEYPVSSVGTTTAGEVSQASGPLLVGELPLLKLLGMASANRFPLAAAVAGLTLLELMLSLRSRPKTATVLEPTVPVEPLYDDDFLRFFSAEDAKWELSDADYARWKQLQDVDASAAWAAALAAEAGLQTQLESTVTSAMTELRDGINDFSGSVQTYSGALEFLLRESDGIRQLFFEWNREGGVKDMMWWADLADAVVGIARLAINLGAGTAKLVVRALSSVDEAADAARTGEALAEGAARADEVIDGSARAAQAEGGGVRFGEANDIYDGADFKKFDEELVQLLGRDFDDYTDALPEAARRLGYYMDFTDADRAIIQRLIVKARLASNGKPVAYDPDDLAWLHRMSQDPNFWENLRKGAALDIDARVYQMVDDVEMGWLRNLADSPEAANAARNMQFDSVPTMPPSGATMPPPGVTPPPTGATLPPPGFAPPPSSATLPYPGVIPLPQGPPPGTAALSGSGAITLPPPTSLPPGGTLPHVDVIPLPHGPPASGVTVAPPGGTPMDVVRLGEAGANPSSLGGLSVQPGAPPPPGPAGAFDVVSTPLEGGGNVSQGYQIGRDLDLLGGER